ncbi:MAG: M48 family metalloprotease [Desulfovibrionaceae bacterium]
MPKKTPSFERDLARRGLSRRDFLRLASAGTATALLAPLLEGCAKNPVTGESQLMLLSPAQEIALDKENSPHQFSADYGAVQDAHLNTYVSQVGMSIAKVSHRPDMPYSFRAVNATYANAYAFPGGSIAATRGILLKLDNEAELAALLGHEIGHVNYRHTAARMSQGVLISAVALGATAYLSSKSDSRVAPLITGLGAIGSGALLAYYSRSDERQADAYGLEKSTQIGYGTGGQVGLMNVLVGMSKTEPSVIERMFASHPMSSERYETAVNEARTRYAFAADQPLFRERYMDNTVHLRRQRATVEAAQHGEEAMRRNDVGEARRRFGQALAAGPDDYAVLVMMANTLVQAEDYPQARHYAARAKQVYPAEAQAWHADGVSRLMSGDYAGAWQDFDHYDRLLPGNPQTEFLKGLSLEAQGDVKGSAESYARYLKQVRQGQQAKYAYQRLRDWGYVR